MAHTKAGGSTQNLRDSQPKYLGIKLFGGERAQAGSIIVRQRGTRFEPGRNVCRGKDDTLYAIMSGTVNFKEKRAVRFDGTRIIKKIVSVV